VDDLVTPAGRRIDGRALTLLTTRSGGPGGQHANTSDTAVTIVLDVAAAGLDEGLTARLIERLGSTVTIRSADTRSQWRNRHLAAQRLGALLDEAAIPPRPRHPTKVTRAAKAQRREDKARRSTVKQSRRRPTIDPAD
jgi:ribosome-associated protein